MAVRFGGIPAVVVTPSACGMRAANPAPAAEFESEESLIVVCVSPDLVPNVKVVPALGLVGTAEGILTRGICGTIAVTEATVREVAVAIVEEPEADALASVSFAEEVCFRRVSEVELALSASAVPARCCATPADPSSISVTSIDVCARPSTRDEATLSAAADDEAVLPNEFAFGPSGLKTDVVEFPPGVWLEGSDTGFSPRFEFVTAVILDRSNGGCDPSPESKAFARG
jgi:hypothetical protein